MEEPRKLKRGLKDISPLFQSPEPEAEKKPCISSSLHLPSFEGDFQVVSLFHPSRQDAVKRLCSVLAGKARDTGRACTVLSMDPAGAQGTQAQREGVRFLNLGASDFETLGTQAGTSRVRASEPQASIVFLEYSPAYPLELRNLLPMLDKWVFWVDGTMENLAEVYRMMKAGSVWNKKTDYFLIYDGPAGDKTGSRLFEKLADMASRRLGISLYWLGSCLSSAAPEAVNYQTWDIDGLFSKTNPFNLSEKKALAGFIGGHFS